jgi:hypothetical protein
MDNNFDMNIDFIVEHLLNLNWETDFEMDFDLDLFDENITNFMYDLVDENIDGTYDAAAAATDGAVVCDDYNLVSAE